MNRPTFPAAVAAAALLLAGCASDDAAPGDEPTTPADPGYPVTVGDLTLEAQPSRIVSLSATATEMLFAIGAGGQVVAVDEFSTYPPEAPTTDLSGFTPNVEAIAGYDPDLVVISSGADELAPRLGELAIPVHLAPDTAATLEDTYAQITDLGVITGHAEGAADLVQRMSDDIAKLVADVPQRTEPLTYYHELDDNLYTVTSETFIGELYELAGLENIADGHDPAGTGYPQLSAEVLVDANPDLIFLADTKCCGQSAETVSARAGWSEIEAVKTGRIIELDDDVASRWGPRVVDLLRFIVDAVSQVP